MKKSFWKTLGPGILVFSILSIFIIVSCKNTIRKKQGKINHPNVILILSDDQGWGDIHHHGNTILETPTLDRLAAEGAAFENFYVEPLCAPTRAGLLTGKYYLRTGTSWVSRGLENMDPSEITLAELFRTNGYATGCFGKWHNGAHYLQHPNQQGFDEFVGFCAGHWNNYFNTTLEKNGTPIKATGYITDFLTWQAISFIRNNKDKPFFCYIPYNVPHSPFQVPDIYFDRYKSKGLNDKDACVYGMIANMDDNIGNLLMALDSLSLAKNTIVIFLSDNGPNGHRYNGKLKGIKGSIDEGGVKVPFFIRWPGKISAGTSINSMGAYIDVAPTLAGLCNLTVPDNLRFDGINLSPLLTGVCSRHLLRKIFSKKSSFPVNADGAVRTDTFRLEIRGTDTLLYNMTEDPGQTTNIASREPLKLKVLVNDYHSYYISVREDYTPNTTIIIGAEGDTLDYLPAHEAHFSGHPVYKEGHGWAHDWLVQWSDTSDRIWWDIKSLSTGRYEVMIRYTCPAGDTGAVIAAYTQTSQTVGKIQRAFDPPYIPSPDRVPRIEVYEKPWAKAGLGRLTIHPGDQKLRLRAIRIAGSQVCELKGLYLRKLSDR
ncbi:MAG: arylsulfatase [Chlorobi bacterium]|nr:arylsulfatase [Chlorobiota bacterium]